MRKRTLAAVKLSAWKKRSAYIRRLEDGVCYTCGAYEWNEELGENDWKKMQAGHFRHNVLDYDPLNIHCQCVRCNKWLHGNATAYATRLVRDYGPDVLNEIEKRANLEKQQIRKIDYYLLQEELFTKLLERLDRYS